MTRIQPECFMEVFYNDAVELTQDQEPLSYMDATPYCRYSGHTLHIAKIKPIACFQIKTQSTTLAERLEARKVNNNLK